jgi:hypothetical protein
VNHLLNSCPYTAQIQDQSALIMCTSDRKRDNIIDTITYWRDQVFHSSYLNRIWQLLPGFILWQVWKERNRRLFMNDSLLWHHSWNQCRLNILETLNLQLWFEKDLINNPSELLILQYWKPSPNLHPLSSTSSPPPPSIPSSWSTPPKDFIKLNFDGASKGNPRAVGYKVVFHNHRGHIILINVGSLGHTTNNVAKLWGLIRGFQLAIEHSLTKSSISSAEF